MTIYKKMNMENKDLERAIYMWFSMKYGLYNKLNHDDSIYLYYDGEEYADIVIDKKHQEINFKWDFWEEFSEIFPIKFNEFKEVMTKWFKDTFNLVRLMPGLWGLSGSVMLMIPNNKQN